MEKNLFVCIFLAFFLHFSTLSFVHAQVTDISTDKQALLALKARISHDPSNLLTSNWSTSSSVCHWMGITCGARHSRVTALNISHLGLIATLPPQLGNLSFLSRLDINDNSFYGALPEEYAQLRRLKYLVLSRNSLSGEVPASIFDNLPNLQLLYLHFNKFEGKIPSTISKCRSLQNLSLSFNNFTGAIPKEIGNLTQLREIYLGVNKLGGEIPKELGNLAKLELLSLQNSYLTGTIPSLIFNLSFLISMDFWENSLTGSLPENMCQHFPNLEELYLSYNHLSGRIPYSLGQCRMLRILMLSNNQFEEHIPRGIGNLTLIKYLYLNSNKLTATLPPQLGNLSFLSRLDISNNSFYGSLPASIFDNVPNLQLLYLHSNIFEGKIPSTLSRCRSLQNLSLSVNNFTGAIPKEIGNMTQLREIYLGANKLQGEIPKEFGNLAKLELLSLQNIYLTGTIPSLILNLSSLISMDFWKNSLTGSLLENMCQHLPNLEELYMDYNHLTGPIPRSLGKCRKLHIIGLSNNQFEGHIPREIGNLTLIRSLYLGSNKLTGEIPYEIGNLHNLERLGLGYNHLVGPVPATIFNISTMQVLVLYANQLSKNFPSIVELPNLEGLYLWGNNFSGPFPGFITNASKLSILSIQSNSFSGFIPSTIGNLKNLEFLDLTYNYFTSTPDLSFLSSLANCNSLRVLGLAINPLNSILPSSIGNLSISLEYFYMDDCNISGKIPKEIGNLKNLINLQLQDNELIGPIPVTMDGLQNLQGLYLQNNKFEGLIPEFFCHLNELYELNLKGSKFYGVIPACIGKLAALRKLSLGSNRLTSSIPSTLWNLKDLLYFDLSSNFLDGSLPLDIGNFKVAIAINLSRNLFSGEIPIAIGSLENLQSLSLGYNRLQGSIPETFGNLKSLEFLDLSGNNLFGVIPKSLEALMYLKYLNLSFNQLSGEIPRGGSFKNFSAESFMGNFALCGPPQLQVPPCKKRTHQKSRTKKIFLLIFLPTSIAVSLVVLVLMSLLIRKRRTRPTNNVDLCPGGTWRKISYQELVRATDRFSENNLLGKGSYGSVYKGRLDEGMEVAAKVFHLDFEGALTSFETECEVIRGLRHRNLVKIISSCSNDDFRSLILEYMPNGSLEKLLFDEKNVLDISHRLNIMIDVASALEYLHFGYSVPIIHCDLKPNNVLLDEHMVAHLSDFGIAKLLGEENSMTQTKTLATIGYMAPEYGREGKVSRQGDVYSYGVMLMVTFTKKKPTNEMFTEEMSLRRWVSESLSSTVMQVVDIDLLTRDDEHFSSKEECVLSILSLAMECTKESPLHRITMKEVMTRLIKIRAQLAKIETRKERNGRTG